MTGVFSYELTGASKTSTEGVTLHRIRAIRDIPIAGVRKGDLGGWVSSVELADGRPRISGDAWVSDDACVFGNAQVSEAGRVCHRAQVYGDARIRDTARVAAGAQVYDHALIWGGGAVSGGARVFGNAQVFGCAEAYGDARVFGDAEISGSAEVFENALVYGEAEVSGNAVINRDAAVTRSSHFMTIGPIGSSGVFATVFRTASGGHHLDLGCWNGTLSTLVGEVDRRRAESQIWRNADASTRELWLLQYEMLTVLGEAAASRWSPSEGLA